MTEDQKIAASSNIRNAFALFIEARRHLTIWEFQEALTKQITECGGHGFVASMGDAIIAATGRTKPPEPIGDCSGSYSGTGSAYYTGREPR